MQCKVLKAYANYIHSEYPGTYTEMSLKIGPEKKKKKKNWEKNRKNIINIQD